MKLNIKALSPEQQKEVIINIARILGGPKLSDILRPISGLDPNQITSCQIQLNIDPEGKIDLLPLKDQDDDFRYKELIRYFSKSAFSQHLTFESDEKPIKSDKYTVPTDNALKNCHYAEIQRQIIELKINESAEIAILGNHITITIPESTLPMSVKPDSEGKIDFAPFMSFLNIESFKKFNLYLITKYKQYIGSKLVMPILPQEETTKSDTIAEDHTEGAACAADVLATTHNATGNTNIGLFFYNPQKSFLTTFHKNTDHINWYEKGVWNIFCASLTNIMLSPPDDIARLLMVFKSSLKLPSSHDGIFNPLYKKLLYNPNLKNAFHAEFSKLPTISLVNLSLDSIYLPDITLHGITVPLELSLSHNELNATKFIQALTRAKRIFVVVQLRDYDYHTPDYSQINGYIEFVSSVVSLLKPADLQSYFVPPQLQNAGEEHLFANSFAFDLGKLIKGANDILKATGGEIDIKKTLGLYGVDVGAILIEKAWQDYYNGELTCETLNLLKQMDIRYQKNF
ncbi:MAG UNVERIFIED_CONTAM: hypothetical protein LVQ98_07925 [Rickettsiaceae bacterium]|jgi:hypothetical protein